MLIFTTSTFQQPNRNVPSLYCQGSTPPAIIYVGRTPTTEHNHCSSMSSSNLSITYTMIKAIEMQTLIIGVIISKSLQEVLQSDVY